MTLATVCPTQIVLAGYTFTFAALIEPKRSAGRGYIAYQPHSRYSRFGVEPLNPHGLGPFCKFSISGLPHDSGIYVFVVDSVPRYVGRTVDFASRMGPVKLRLDFPEELLPLGPVDELQNQ